MQERDTWIRNWDLGSSPAYLQERDTWMRKLRFGKSSSGPLSVTKRCVLYRELALRDREGASCRFGLIPFLSTRAWHMNKKGCSQAYRSDGSVWLNYNMQNKTTKEMKWNARNNSRSFQDLETRLAWVASVSAGFSERRTFAQPKIENKSSYGQKNLWKRLLPSEF